MYPSGCLRSHMNDHFKVHQFNKEYVHDAAVSLMYQYDRNLALIFGSYFRI